MYQPSFSRAPATAPGDPVLNGLGWPSSGPSDTGRMRVARFAGAATIEAGHKPERQGRRIPDCDIIYVGRPLGAAG